jgi:NAD(P)-dependent dehydrogenase (short-subunit alcohol dehydrogenase family)
MTQVFDLTGRTALVTGAARGLGRAIAIGLADAGADIALGLRDKSSDAGLVAEIEKRGQRALPLQLDVKQLDEGRRAIDHTIAAFGKLDILVNNAGGGIDEMPVEDVSEADFDEIIDLNVRSTFFLSQYAGRHMIARRQGAIVNMGSQAGAVALPGEAAYCMGKAAVSHMTKCFAVEWGTHNVRVNCVAPTFFATDGTTDMLARPDFHADVLNRIAALHRIGEPHEVAGAVVFLASDAARYVHGTILPVDGGWLAR